MIIGWLKKVHTWKFAVSDKSKELMMTSWKDIFREKLDVISSNIRGQPSYSYFSFFVCRNPVFVHLHMMNDDAEVSYSWQTKAFYFLVEVSKLGSIYRYNLKRSARVRSIVRKRKIANGCFLGSTPAWDLKWVATFFCSVHRPPCFR